MSDSGRDLRTVKVTTSVLLAFATIEPCNNGKSYWISQHNDYRGICYAEDLVEYICHGWLF